MKRIILSLALVILPLLGILDAGFITYEKANGLIPPCTVHFQCGTVLNSAWASIGPIPLSVMGLLFYSTFLFFGIWHFFEKKDFDLLGLKINIDTTLIVLGISGWFFSLYLVYVMGFILHAWCLYCVLSAINCTILFIITFFYLTNPVVPQVTRFLYRTVIKPIFFRFDPELIHNFNVIIGEFLGSFAPLRWILKSAWCYQNLQLSKKINGIVFSNPIGLSAGFDYNGKLTGILPAVGFGFHTIGTVTLHPYKGNNPPRLSRLPRSKSLLVNKGLKNDGARKIIKRLKKVKFKIPVGISIASTNKEYRTEKEQITDIVECFSLFEQSTVKHSYYELNISCPNTFGGEPFTSPEKLERLMKRMDRLKLSRPLYIKMPIDQSQSETRKLLSVLKKHRVQGVIFGNLTKDHTNPAVHIEDRKTWQNRSGNLSGKPTWERSNDCIQFTKSEFGSRFTIIGTGGIFSGEDARTKMELGADLVQLITGMIYEGPQLIGEMNRYLAEN
jgi:dihydroorotate dehydrogenase